MEQTFNRIARVPRDVLRVTESGSITAEASTIGLDVGEWPDVIAVPDRSGRPVIFGFKGLQRDADGDVQFGHYTAALGSLVLTVWND